MNNFEKERIFCSYAREDEECVKRFEGEIERYLSVWADYKDIIPGADWKKAISQGIRESNYFCIFASENWTNSSYCQVELEIAKGASKAIFLILLDEQVALPRDLARSQWIMWENDNYVAEVLAAVAFIKSQINSQPTHYLLQGIMKVYVSTEEISLNACRIVPIDTPNIYTGKIMKNTIARGTSFFEIVKISKIVVV